MSAVGLLRSLVDLVLGYDFFISYSHSDGHGYPRRLADGLNQFGFKTFLDERVYVAGDDLRTATRRRVRMSRCLVVVARPHALQSYWVSKEVENSISAGRTLVVVDIRGTFAQAPINVSLKADLKDRLYISDLVTEMDGAPSSETLDRLRTSFAAVRQDALRLRVAAGVALGFATLAMFAAWQWRGSKQNWERALARQLAAQSELMISAEPPLLPRSLLLAVESMRRLPSLEADQALRHGIELLPRLLLRIHHQGAVHALAYGPDGKYLLSGTKWNLEKGPSDDSGRVWSAETGQAIHRFHHGDSVSAVAISPDGKIAATASNDGFAALWDLRTGALIRRLTHSDSVASVAFNPEGASLATGGSDEYLRLWRLIDGRELLRVALGNRIDVVRFARGGRFVASGSGTGVYLTDLARGTTICLPRLPASASSDLVTDVNFSSDGRYLAAASRDGMVRVWVTLTGQPFRTLTHPGVVESIVFAPDGALLATACDDNFVRLWDVQTGRELTRMPHEHFIFPVVFSADGMRLASGSVDHTARLWEVPSGREVARMDHEGSVLALAFSPDGAQLATGGTDQEIKLWRVRQEFPLIRSTSQVKYLSFSKDGEYLAAGGDGTSLGIWRVKTGDRVRELSIEGYYLIGLGFNQGIKRVFAATRSLLVQEWNTETGFETRHTLHGQPPGVEGGVLTAAFANDGSRVATGNTDGLVNVRDLKDGSIVAQWHHVGRVKYLDFSSDGRYLASGGEDKTARVWDIPAGRQVASISHDGSVDRVTFSGDGSRLATTSGLTAYVWAWAEGRMVGKMPFELAVWSLSLSAKGDFLATGGADGAARVWEVKGGTELARVRHRGDVEAIAFSPDGWHVVSGSSDGTIRIWPWRPADMIEEACSRLNRNLTPAEWRSYIGDEPYQTTCPSLRSRPASSLGGSRSSS